MRPILLATALPFALVACSQQTAEEAPAPAATDSPMPVEPSGGAGDGATPPSSGTDARDPSTAPETVIPMAFQGRWGMVPADCASNRSDAKGLLTIGSKVLRFYESVGTLKGEATRSDTTIRGQFEFTGEGMTWNRDVTLSLSPDGDTLTRLDRGDDQPGGPFTYARCG